MLILKFFQLVPRSIKIWALSTFIIVFCSVFFDIQSLVYLNRSIKYFSSLSVSYGLEDSYIAITSFFVFIASIFRIFSIYAIFSLSGRLTSFAGKKLFQNYLELDYRIQKSISPEKLISLLSNKLDHFNSYIQNYLMMLSGLLMTIGILSRLLLTDFYASIFLLIGLVSAYFVCYKLTSSVIRRNVVTNKVSFSSLVAEIQNSAFDLKRIGRPGFFAASLQQIYSHMKVQRESSAKVNSFAQSPKNLVEAFGIISALSLMTLSIRSQDQSFAIAGLVTTLFGFVRVLQPAQQVYSSISLVKSFQLTAHSILLAVISSGLDGKQFIDVSELSSVSDNPRESIFVQSKLVCSSESIFQGAPLLSLDKTNVNHGDSSNASSMLHSYHDFKAYRGQFISVVGPSGCGKTSFLDFVAGLYPPSSGHLFFESLNVWGSSESLSYYRNFVGYCSQKHALLQSNVLSVILSSHSPRFSKQISDIDSDELIWLEEIYYGLGLNTVDDDFERLMLSNVGSSNESRFSMGQQCRISLARALFSKPRVLLLDEVFSNLDRSSRLCIAEFIGGYVRDSRSVCFSVSHYDLDVDDTQSRLLFDTLTV